MPAQSLTAEKNARLFSYISFILIGTVNTFLGPILPFLSEKWKINDAEGGYFLAAQSLGGMCGTLAASFLYSRISSRKILFTGFGLIIISLLGIGNGTWEIGFFSSLINGIAIGFIIPTTTLIVSQNAGNKRAGAINLLNFFWALGAVLSPLIFLQLTTGARLNYSLLAIALTGAAFFGLLFRQRDFRLVADRKESVLSWSEKLLEFGAGWIFALTIFLQIGVEASLSGWLPTYAKRFAASEIWLVVPFVYWTGFLLSRLLSSIFLERISERKLIIYGLILVVAGQILIISSEHLILISAGALLTGFGTAPIFPTTIALASAKFEKKAPELINYLFLLSSFSGIFFLWLIGLVSSAAGGLKTAFFVPVICSLMLLLLHLLKSNPNKRAAHFT